METGPSAQLVHAAPFYNPEANPNCQRLAHIHLTHVIVYMLFKRQNFTRLHYYLRQLVPDTHHPLCEKIAPLDISVSLPSQLNLCPLVLDSPTFRKRY